MIVNSQIYYWEKFTYPPSNYYLIVNDKKKLQKKKKNRKKKKKGWNSAEEWAGLDPLPAKTRSQQSVSLPFHLGFLSNSKPQSSSSPPRAYKNPPPLINTNVPSPLFPFYFLLNFSKNLNFIFGLVSFGLGFIQLGSNT